MSNCIRIEARMTWFKSDTLPRHYLSEFKTMINIPFKYVTLTTYAFNPSAITRLFCQAAFLCSLMVTVFLS